jgi:hypothetical protein
MKYWLFKSEPDAFSIDDLERDGTSEWSGVRNFQARNTMKEMTVGDLGFFYHSSCKPPGIAGVLRVSAAAHPDSTQFDPKSEYHDGSSRNADPNWEIRDPDKGNPRRMPDGSAPPGKIVHEPGDGGHDWHPGQRPPGFEDPNPFLAQQRSRGC